MRFLLYNIRYGTGGNMNRFPLSGYFRRTDRHLDKITSFLQEHAPDIIGLIEVDSGSYRTRHANQAERIAETLGHYHTYRGKYAESAKVATRLPVLNKQGNAFITSNAITQERFHYVTKGMKRLVIELELDNLVVLLVHLALSYRTRHEQLRQLKQIVCNLEKPCLVAGDFNSLTGAHELELFMEAAGLQNAGPIDAPTYPSWNPSKHLDFILHSPELHINHFEIPRVNYSDHLPLICDFDFATSPEPTPKPVEVHTG